MDIGEKTIMFIGIFFCLAFLVYAINLLIVNHNNDIACKNKGYEGFVSNGITPDMNVFSGCYKTIYSCTLLDKQLNRPCSEKYKVPA